MQRWWPKDVDVIDRNCFTNSRLCINYTEHVCQLLLDKAKEQIQQGNTQEGLSFLSEATAASSSEHVSPGFRTTAEFAIQVFRGSIQGELELLEFLLPDEEQSKKHIGFLMSWAPNAEITQAVQLMQPNAKLN